MIRAAFVHFMCMLADTKLQLSKQTIGSDEERMRQELCNSHAWFLLVLIPILILGGCGSARLADAPKPSPTPSPTQVLLSVIQAVVRRFPETGAEITVNPGESIAIQANDRIKVEEKGRGFLEFPHQLEVEVVRGTEMKVNAVHLDPTGTVEVALRQISGHSFTRTESTKAVHIVIDTDYATATTLADNTQFLVCHVPGILTCVVAANGEVQVRAQDQVVNLKSGEVTYVVPNRPPVAPFCADMTEIREWWARMRGTEDTNDLGSLLAGWMRSPCAVASAEAATTPAAPASTAPATSTPIALPAVPGSTEGSPPSVTVSPPTMEPATPAGTAAGTTIVTPPPQAPASSPTSVAATSLPSPDDMVKIGKGHYVVGVPVPDANHDAGREVDLPGFWIDKYTVTNVQYKAFLDGTGAAAPPTWSGGAFPTGHEYHPVTGLTWDAAAAYCGWTGKRLPDEAEWEAAGRGPGAEPPLFPWGSDPTAGGKTGALPQADTYPVGSLAFNQSSSGVYDLVGSVWQWVGEAYSPVPAGFKVLRGGRRGLLQDLAYFQPAKPDDDRFTRIAGVRCAADRVAGE